MKLSTAYYNLFYLVILEGIRPFGVTQTGGGQRSTPRNEDGCPPMPDLPNIAPAAVPMSAAAGSSSTAASSNVMLIWAVWLLNRITLTPR